MELLPPGACLREPGLLRGLQSGPDRRLGPWQRAYVFEPLFFRLRWSRFLGQLIGRLKLPSNASASALITASRGSGLSSLNGWRMTRSRTSSIDCPSGPV